MKAVEVCPSIICLCLLLPSAAARADFATDVRHDWQIPPQYSDALVNYVAFSPELYGLNWASAALAIMGYDGFVLHLSRGDYHLAANEISMTAAVDGVDSFAAQALGFPATATIAVTAFQLSLNAFRYSAELTAFRLQHDRYFLARPHNSFLAILNLPPFELLDRVAMTKDANGWLFTTSGYLTPMPSGNWLTPAEFYGLAELAWQSVNLDRNQLIAERAELRQRFLARLATVLAGDTARAAPLSATAATLTWDCAPATVFHVDHSTNLVHWVRRGPFTSAAARMEVTLPGLPPGPCHFFRIVSEP